MENHIVNSDKLKVEKQCEQEVEGQKIVSTDCYHHNDEDDVDQVIFEEWIQVLDPSERLKWVIMERQRNWIIDYMSVRDKWLMDVTEKLHEEFLVNEEKTTRELCQQFDEELDTIKVEREKKYQKDLANKIKLMEACHQARLRLVKKSQWCWQCEKEAIYHCCWNTAYCSRECQRSHWLSHKMTCKRKPNIADEEDSDLIYLGLFTNLE